MEQALLIDALVHRVADLIVDLALVGQAPVHLGHLSDLFFQSLDRRLRGHHQKSQPVAADLFGLPLRTYQHRVRATARSATQRELTLWEAVYRHVRDHDQVTRGELETRFCRENPTQLRSIVHDLIHSGLVLTAGRGDSTVYQANRRVRLGSEEDPDVDAQLTWVAVYEHPGATPDMLADALAIPPLHRPRLDGALTRLVGEGRIICDDHDAEAPRFHCQTFVFHPGQSDAVWASIYDHFSMMIDGLCDALRVRRGEDAPDGLLGGATYRFELIAGSPRTEEARVLLAELRARCTALRSALDAELAGGGRSDGRVLFYFGQTHRPPVAATDHAIRESSE